MKTEIRSRGVLRLTPCSYGLSKLSFRGPMRPTEGRYIVCLGGSETFAKYVAQPYPDLIETAIGEVCVNLGYQSAGPDVFVNDSAVGSLCHDAAAVVIQLVGAINLNNSFYKVHPRHNDRFIAPTADLVALYPEIDFAEIAFTGHLIRRLQSVDEGRFALVREHLQVTWQRRMRRLVKLASGPVILLWFSNRTPGKGSDSNDPAFVTRAMVEHLRPHVADVVEVTGQRGDAKGMCFAPLNAVSAAEMLSVQSHLAAAKALRTPLVHAMSEQ